MKNSLLSNTPTFESSYLYRNTQIKKQIIKGLQVVVILIIGFMMWVPMGISVIGTCLTTIGIILTFDRHIVKGIKTMWMIHGLVRNRRFNQVMTWTHDLIGY